MALSRRSSWHSGGNGMDLEVEGSPATDGGVGTGSNVACASGVAPVVVAAELIVFESSFFCVVSVSTLMALKELDSQMETRGLTRSLHPLHCRKFPMRDKDLNRKVD